MTEVIDPDYQREIRLLLCNGQRGVDLEPSRFSGLPPNICIFNIREDPLEKEVANPLRYPCLENLMDRGLQSMGSQRVGYD